MTTEVHILLGCADARDVGANHLRRIEEAVAEAASRGVSVDWREIRVPGSFATPEVLADLRTLVLAADERHARPGKLPAYFVHVQTHGEFEDCDRPTFGLKVREGSPLNCGMLGATGLGLQIEELLLNEKPTLDLRGSALKIDSPADIRRLLREAYGYDGYLAGDWLRSIDDLRTHARAQRSALERMIAADPALRPMRIGVTANVQDYRARRTARLDEDGDPVPFWDGLIVRGWGEPDELMGQTERQNPEVGMFLTDGASTRMRETAFERATGREYAPNRVFALAGGAFDVPSASFGPYMIGGFYYAARHLGVDRWLIVAEDARTRLRIAEKIRRDPLLALLARLLGVTIEPVEVDR